MRILDRGQTFLEHGDGRLEQAGAGPQVVPAPADHASALLVGGGEGERLAERLIGGGGLALGDEGGAEGEASVVAVAPGRPEQALGHGGIRQLERSACGGQRLVRFERQVVLEAQDRGGEGRSRVDGFHRGQRPRGGAPLLQAAQAAAHDLAEQRVAEAHHRLAAFVGDHHQARSFERREQVDTGQFGRGAERHALGDRQGLEDPAVAAVEQLEPRGHQIDQVRRGERIAHELPASGLVDQQSLAEVQPHQLPGVERDPLAAHPEAVDGGRADRPAERARHGLLELGAIQRSHRAAHERERGAIACGGHHEHQSPPDELAERRGGRGVQQRRIVDVDEQPARRPGASVHGLHHLGGHLLGVVGLELGGERGQGAERVRWCRGGDHPLGDVAQGSGPVGGGHRRRRLAPPGGSGEDHAAHRRLVQGIEDERHPALDPDQAPRLGGERDGHSGQPNKPGQGASRAGPACPHGPAGTRRGEGLLRRVRRTTHFDAEPTRWMLSSPSRPRSQTP